MNNSSFITCIVLSLFFVQLFIDSCSVKKNEPSGSKTFFIDVENAIDLKTSVAFDSIRFVLLEDNSETVLDNIKKIELRGERIFLSLAANPPVIFVYNKSDGSYVGSFSNSGPGPGEYETIDDFQVIDNKTVAILDSRNQKLIVYDISNGDVKEVKNLPFLVNEFEIKDDKFVFYRKVQAVNFEDSTYFYRILVTDSDLNVINKYLPFKIEPFQSYHDISMGYTLINSNNRIFYNQWDNDTLFTIKEDSIFPKFIFDYGKYSRRNIFRDQFNSPIEEIQYLVENNDKYVMMNHFFAMNENYYSMIFLLNNNKYFVLIDRDSHETQVIRSIVDNQSEQIKLPPPYFTQNGRFVSYITSSEIQLNYELEELSTNNETVEVFKKVAQDGGLLLLFYDFKD